MKRRDMIKKTAIGAASLTIATGGSAAHAAKEDIPKKPLPTLREMTYRPLGKTGMRVSMLGFGSHLSVENRENPVRRNRQVQEAMEMGINLFDVYDHGGYKQFMPMSKSLAGKRDKVLISLVAVEKDVRTEIEGALRTFNTDHIDLYRIVYKDGDSHNKGEEELDILFRMKEEGKIRAVGVVAHNELGLVDAAKNKPIDYVMMPINFHHNKAWMDDAPDGYSDLLPICREKGIGVLGIKPMGGDPLVAYAQHIGMLSPDYRGTSYPKAALRYLWQNPDVSSCLPSINSVGELWSNLETVWEPEFTRDDKAVLKKLSKRADKTFGEYLPDHYKWMENWRIRNV